MIDMHTHIIPNIDDGSYSEELSLKMIQKEIENGVDKIICTPHFRPYKFEKSIKEIESIFKEFKNLVKKNGFNVDLFLGQEIYCNNDYKNFMNHDIITINKTQCVLLEFSVVSEIDIENFCYNILSMNYIPILAHAERYVYLDIDKFFKLKEMGCLIQVNSSGLMGENGIKIKNNIIDLIKNNLVDFVASDIHFDRKFLLKEAFDVVKRKFGDDKAEELFVSNSKKYFNIK